MSLTFTFTNICDVFEFYGKLYLSRIQKREREISSNDQYLDLPLGFNIATLHIQKDMSAEQIKQQRFI